MFKLWKENQRLKEQLKQKALQITALIQENEKLKYKLYTINAEIDRFNHLEGNPFSLMGRIKKEADYSEPTNQPLNKQTNNN